MSITSRDSSIKEQHRHDMKLVSLSSAALFAASAVSASQNIAVYEFPGKYNSETPSASMKTSLLYLADKFGAGEHYSIGQNDEAIDFVDAVHEESSGKPELLVLLKGVDTPEHLLESLSPTFQIEAGHHDKVAHHLVKTLFKKLPKQIAESRNSSKVYHLTEEIKYIHANVQGDALSQQFKYFNLEMPQAWADLVKESAAGSESSQQVMGGSGLKLVNDKLYINEIMQMVKMGSTNNYEGDFIVANLDSLHSIGHRIGYNSRTYQVAKGALLKSISALNHKFDITIVALGTDHKVASDEPQLSKRANELAGVFTAFAKRGAVAAKSCFEDEAACQASTNSCNGHGSCKEVQAKCWQCLCSATQDKKTSKTTKWAGYDCSKKDIAAQAHLLLWTSVALLATLVGGVKLLFQMDSEELPGVLQAATIDTSR